MSTHSSLTKKTFDISWLVSVAKDQETIDKIKEISSWNTDVQRGVFQESNRTFSLKLGKHTVWLRESEAWFAIHLYDHIFKEREHLNFPGFDGSDSSVIIDMGANIGMYTLAIKDNNLNCKVISFEPNPKAFELLSKNIESNNLQDVIMVNKGVSKSSGKFQMKVLDEGSAYGGKYLGDIKKEYRTWIQEKRFKNINVESLSLFDILSLYSLEAVDILKMDVEGMELEILEGGIGVLARIKRIVIEWHDHLSREKIIALLKGNNFSLVYDDGREYGNLYFINSIYEK